MGVKSNKVVMAVAAVAHWRIVCGWVIEDRGGVEDDTSRKPANLQLSLSVVLAK